MTISRRRQEIHAMPDFFASYNNQTLASGTPRNDFSVTGTLGANRVFTAPLPPPEVRKNSPSGYYSRRPNKNLARREAIKTAKKTGNLHGVEPDDIGKSLTNDGEKQQKTYLAQAKERFCSAAAPSHAVLDRTQNAYRQFANYLPNAFVIALRTLSASVVETTRWMCLEPADRASEETSLTDLPSLVEKLDRPPEWATARLVEDT